MIDNFRIFFSTGSTMVIWCSKKQPVVTVSSTEAEYVAATMAAQECMWLKRLIGEMLCKVDYAVQISVIMEVLSSLHQIQFFMVGRST